jgi:hypothetical protein
LLPCVYMPNKNTLAGGGAGAGGACLCPRGLSTQGLPRTQSGAGTAAGPRTKRQPEPCRQQWRGSGSSSRRCGQWLAVTSRQCGEAGEGGQQLTVFRGPALERREN